MKIAVSSSGKTLEAQLDPRFGRCSCFLIINPEDMSVEVFENENAALGGGAGIQSAQFVVSKGAGAVITGHCGPNAMQVLSAAGIKVYTGQSGPIKDAVSRYQNGELTPAAEADVSSHAGMGRMGMGRGKAMGRGRGMGSGGRGNRG
jgi:predicted Fe-Mo cluster-binding NifX family protein